MEGQPPTNGLFTFCRSNCWRCRFARAVSFTFRPNLNLNAALPSLRLACARRLANDLTSSANAPIVCHMARPVGVAVSVASMNQWNFTPRARRSGCRLVENRNRYRNGRTGSCPESVWPENRLVSWSVRRKVPSSRTVTLMIGWRATRLIREGMKNASMPDCKRLLLLTRPIRSQTGRPRCATTFSCESFRFNLPDRFLF